MTPASHLSRAAGLCSVRGDAWEYDSSNKKDQKQKLSVATGALVIPRLQLELLVVNRRSSLGCYPSPCFAQTGDDICCWWCCCVCATELFSKHTIHAVTIPFLNVIGVLYMYRYIACQMYRPM